MSRSEYVVNVQGFSVCASKGMRATVSRKGGFNVVKAVGYVLALLVVLAVPGQELMLVVVLFQSKM